MVPPPASLQFTCQNSPSTPRPLYAKSVEPSISPAMSSPSAAVPHPDRKPAGKLATREPAAAAAPPPAAVAAQAAAQRISVRISMAEGQAETSCVVCLQPCSSKACSCSYMHKDCAEQYAKTFSAAKCKVCGVGFEPSRLNKRKIDDEDRRGEELARKRARERAATERATNLEWARLVAPSAAHILLRHYRHAEEESGPGAAEVRPLCFDSVVLSLVHSGEQYLDDLSERLCDTQPQSTVEVAAPHDTPHPRGSEGGGAHAPSGPVPAAGSGVAPALHRGRSDDRRGRRLLRRPLHAPLQPGARAAARAALRTRRPPLRQ